MATNESWWPEWDIALEVRGELAAYRARGEPIPPPLAARAYRGQKDIDPDAATKHREFLHREAEDGNEFAQAVLALLADDPFWAADEEERRYGGSDERALEPAALPGVWHPARGPSRPRTHLLGRLSGRGIAAAAPPGRPGRRRVRFPGRSSRST